MRHDTNELQHLAETARTCAGLFTANSRASLAVGHGVDLMIARRLERRGRDMTRIAEILDDLAGRPAAAVLRMVQP